MKLTKPFIQLPIQWIANDSSQTYIYQNEKKNINSSQTEINK